MLKNSIKADINDNDEYKSYHWKRRPSEIRGYNRVIYTTTERGDYLRVDYNLKDKKVRLYLEDAEEGGKLRSPSMERGSISSISNAIAVGWCLTSGNR